MIRKTLAQIAVLIAAAAILAVVANGFASRERRLVLVGYYPNARIVPPREPEVASPPRETTTVPVSSTPVASQTEDTASAPPTTTTHLAAPVDATQVDATRDRPAVTQTVPPDAPTRADATTHPAVPPTAAPDPLLRFKPHPDKPYIEISGDDAALLHAKGALFLDARRTAAYEEGHVPGARSYSVWEADVDEKVNALFGERSDPEAQNLPIVAYCTGGECEDSHMLAQKLWAIQFNNVYVYKDGFPDWQKRGLPIRKGEQP